MKAIGYEEHMRLALGEARESPKAGSQGFGAVIVKNGMVLAQAHDTEASESDPTAHAEMNAIRRAAQKIGRDLRGCIIISTHEPCPMCSAAIVWAGISRVVYGMSIRDAVKAGRRRIDIGCVEIIQRAAANIEVIGGVLKEECSMLYSSEVREHVARFRGIDQARAGRLEQELLLKRRAWLENNRQLLSQLEGDDLEKAYRLLCRKLGIKEEEAPVVEKTLERIVFHSRNHCPSLEACRILDLDTRKICRWIYQRPTEELVREINPRLRFTRNYDCLRPFADYCEEMFYLEED